MQLEDLAPPIRRQLAYAVFVLLLAGIVLAMNVHFARSLSEIEPDPSRWPLLAKMLSASGHPLVAIACALVIVLVTLSLIHRSLRYATNDPAWAVWRLRVALVPALLFVVAAIFLGLGAVLQLADQARAEHRAIHPDHD